MNSTACETVQQELKAYHDGELSPEERTLVENHLVGCNACRTELAEIGRVRKELQNLNSDHAPDALDPKLKARIMAAIPQTEHGARKWSLTRPQMALWAVAAAAVLTMVAYPSLQNLSDATAKSGGATSTSIVKSQSNASAPQVAQPGAAHEVQAIKRMAVSSPGGLPTVPPAAMKAESSDNSARTESSDGHDASGGALAKRAVADTSVLSDPELAKEKVLYAADTVAGLKTIQKLAMQSGVVITQISRPTAMSGKQTDITICGTPEKVKSILASIANDPAGLSGREVAANRSSNYLLEVEKKQAVLSTFGGGAGEERVKRNSGSTGAGTGGGPGGRPSSGTAGGFFSQTTRETETANTRRISPDLQKAIVKNKAADRVVFLHVKLLRKQ